MKQSILCRLGAVLGGVLLGLTLSFAIPVTLLVSLWRHSFSSSSSSPSTSSSSAASSSSLAPPAPLVAATTKPAEQGKAVVCIALDIGNEEPKDPAQKQQQEQEQEQQQQQQQQQQQNDPFVTTDPSLLLPLFRAHGSGSLSYASLANAEYRHLLCPALGGSIAFVAAPPLLRFGLVRPVMAVGDPLAPRESWAEIGRAFLKAFPNGFFGYASSVFADALLRAEGPGGRRRLHVNDWGLATRIVAAPPASLPGCRSAQQDARRALRSGLRVREVALLDLLLPSAAAVRYRLREISALWVSTKITRDRELRVFCRALDFLDESEDGGGAAAARRDAVAGTRLFVAERCDGGGGGGGDGGSNINHASIDAFVVLDPQCEAGRVVGSVLASSRAHPAAHRGALKLLVQHIVTSGALMREGREAEAEGAEQGRAEGALDLGLAPFAGIAPARDCPFGGGAPWMRMAARFLFSCADGRLYSFKGLANGKGHYAHGRGGEQRPLYCVHRGGGGWAPKLVFLVELYATMVFVGFCGDGVADTVLRLWGARR